MVKKRVDPRVRGLIEHGVRKNHRSLFILVGDHGKDQVENIHRILSKARVKSRPSVLWCYKKELGFSTHRKKRIKEIKKQQSRGLYDPDRDDPFDLFISSTNIRWTYYKETDKILGQTFGMCVLQDFEAITPNLLARTIETVEGGGIIILLLKTVKSLKQLYTLSMDVHSRFRTESHHELTPRFNERFILSLGDCEGCLVLDDELNILPISSNVNYLPTYDGNDENGGGLAEGEADLSGFYNDPELTELKASLVNTPHIGNLVSLTKTMDQAKAVMSFLDCVSDKSLKATVSLTAGRGRGKSAAIGLCLAGAVAFGYSNIFVTAPSPENLKTCFEFIIEGLKALNYAEHLDFEILYEHVSPEVGKMVVRVNIFRNHRQTIQYVLPSDHLKLAQAELVAIDEAAAIPLPTVKKLMGNYLVFLSSTINGYEGTGRSLSLKLIQQLRKEQSSAITNSANAAAASVGGMKGKSKGERKVHEERWKTAANSFHDNVGGGGRTLTEITLQVPIRYNISDPIEKWLNGLLCLDNVAHSFRIVSNIPSPNDCELFLVDRDALFSYHPLAESLLQRIWSLYTSAHYKNTPNDLQILSDAPAHRLFVLLGPQKTAKSGLPDILCVVQIAFEGKISSKSIQSELSKGNKASGDMIPWTLSQQFQDHEFAGLSGMRVVRIATHSDVQKMGYGSRAMDLLTRYFQGELTVKTIVPSAGQCFGGEGVGQAIHDNSVVTNAGKGGEGLQGEVVKPRAKLPPLLTDIHDRPAERLHWLGVSFGLTTELLSFWNRKGFRVVYLRQTTNDLTGEHSCMCLRELDTSNLLGDGLSPRSGWLSSFVKDYRQRLVSLMSFPHSFGKLDSSLALALVDPERELTSTMAMNESNENNNENETANNNNINQEEGNNSGSLDIREILSIQWSSHDFQRLELYSRNLVDHHMILDLIPRLAELFFQGRLLSARVSVLQAAIFLSIGLQHREMEEISSELDLPTNQVMAFFNKTVRKIVAYLRREIEKEAEKERERGEAENRNNKQKKNIQLISLTPAAASLHQNKNNNTINSGRIDRPPPSKKTNIEDAQHEEEQDEQQDEVRQVQKKMILEHKDLSRHQITDTLTDKRLEETLGKKHLREDFIPKTISIPVTPAGVEKKKKEKEEQQASTVGKNTPYTDKNKKNKKRDREEQNENQDEQEQPEEQGGQEIEEEVIEESAKKKNKKHKKDRNSRANEF
jgi:N-acetyltransferase 10